MNQKYLALNQTPLNFPGTRMVPVNGELQKSPLAHIYRVLYFPEVRVPGHDLVTPSPGSGKDDCIRDPFHLAIFEISCGYCNGVVYRNNRASCTDIIKAEEDCR